MRILYHIFIALYTLAIRLAAPFNKKAALWVRGRKDIWQKINEKLHINTAPVIWVHASSLGEFEQGRPVIEKVKTQKPHHKILLTFFSPSGYEVRKNYTGADYIFYLPTDTVFHAQKFIHTIKPVMALFVKYDFWFNYMNELHKNKIPFFYVSAIFRPGQYFFKSYGGWALKQLQKASGFFVQNKTSLDLLKAHGISNVVLSGDTRFDRVKALAASPRNLPLIEQFAAGTKIMVAGSTWPEDDALILPAIKNLPSDLKYIIVPHDIHESYIIKLCSLLGESCQRYSKLNSDYISDLKYIVVDNVGFLSSVYKHATIAYVGGGFGKAIHNILEPACYGKPVIFGPTFHKFREAVELINMEGAFTINSQEAFTVQVNKLLSDENFYKQVSQKCISYVNDNSGASDVIMQHLLPVIK